MKEARCSKILLLIFGICVLVTFNGFSKTLNWDQIQKKAHIRHGKINTIRKTDFMDIYKAQDAKDPSRYHYCVRYVDRKDIPKEDIKNVYINLTKEQAENFDAGKEIKTTVYACKQKGYCGNKKHYLPPGNDNGK